MIYKMKKIFILLFALNLINTITYAQKLKLGLLVYGGGGDWYANPTSLKNLAKFSNQNLGTSFEAAEGKIEVSSPEIFNYPFFHLTGHGRIMFTDAEASNLRNYLMAGGFLHIDDNYGMDKYVRPALKKVFPELDLIELPYTHPIYHQKYEFKNGLPKIHEHDNKPPKGYGLIYNGRLVCYYTSETDLGDGWEDQEVHKDPEEKRKIAFEMGANILQYVFMYK
jgi:Domain of unknown function (DUF4159)